MSSWSRFVLLDPADMERYFSEEDSISNLPTIDEDLREEDIVDLDRVKKVFPMIPPREADFLELYFFKRLRQSTIADLYGVSQPTVCYRLQRGIQRIKYLLSLPVFEYQEMENHLREVLEDSVDVRIMVRLAATTCQSDVARELGATQGFVRYRFFRSLDKLRASAKHKLYAELFEKVAANFNILRDSGRHNDWEDNVVRVVA